MPQMMPISWILLYLFCIMIFINFMMINYFTSNNKIIMLKSNKIHSPHLNWKW